MPLCQHSWNKSNTLIRMLAVVDMMFGTLLFALYTRKLFWPVSEYSQSSLSTSYLFRLILLVPMTINFVQIVMAYNLLICAIKVHEPLVAIGRATMWFQVAVLILILLCMKLFTVLLFANPNPAKGEPTGGMMLTLTEIVFKTFALYVVKDFTDNLKASLNSSPAVQFITVYSPGYNGQPYGQPHTVFV